MVETYETSLILIHGENITGREAILIVRILFRFKCDGARMNFNFLTVRKIKTKINVNRQFIIYTKRRAVIRYKVLPRPGELFIVKVLRFPYFFFFLLHYLLLTTLQRPVTTNYLIIKLNFIPE